MLVPFSRVIDIDGKRSILYRDRVLYLLLIVANHRGCLVLGRHDHDIGCGDHDGYVIEVLLDLVLVGFVFVR
jgi:hypothetical protein